MSTVIQKAPAHVHFNTSAIPFWAGLAGGGAAVGGLIWGAKGAVIVGLGVPVAFGVFIYQAMKAFQ